MTTLHITVGNREQLRQNALQFVQNTDADDPVNCAPARVCPTDIVAALRTDVQCSESETHDLAGHEDDPTFSGSN